MQLPADGEFTARFETDNVSHLDIFLKGYPFKTLYAIHAISDYVEAARYQRLQIRPGTEIASEGLESSQKALERSLRLVVDAISDPEVLDGVSSALRLRIAGSLVQVYVKLFNSERARYLNYILLGSFEILIKDHSCHRFYSAN